MSFLSSSNLLDYTRTLFETQNGEIAELEFQAESPRRFLLCPIKPEVW